MFEQKETFVEIFLMISFEDYSIASAEFVQKGKQQIFSMLQSSEFGLSADYQFIIVLELNIVVNISAAVVSTTVLNFISLASIWIGDHSGGSSVDCVASSVESSCGSDPDLLVGVIVRARHLST